MKITKLIFASTTLLFLIACQKENNKILSYKISNAAEIVTQFNLNKLPHQQGELIEGKVEISNFNNNSIIVKVKAKPYNQAYILQVKNEIEKEYKVLMEEAQIIFLKDLLLVNSLNSPDCYLLKLESSSNLNLIKELKLTETIEGFGISKHKGFKYIENQNETNITLRNESFGTPEFAVECNCELVEAECEDPDAGGVGSSSCSVSSGDESCSVTCTGNFFACCNITE